MEHLRQRMRRNLQLQVSRILLDWPLMLRAIYLQRMGVKAIEYERSQPTELCRPWPAARKDMLMDLVPLLNSTLLLELQSTRLATCTWPVSYTHLRAHE